VGLGERMATVLEGFLQKQGHIFQSWNRRYFILTSSKLSYYTDSSLKKKLKGEYVFTSNSYIRRCEPIDNRHIYLLELHADGTGGTELLMDTENEENLILWQNKINSLLILLQKKEREEGGGSHEPTSRYQLSSSSSSSSNFLFRDLSLSSNFEFQTKLLIRFENLSLELEQGMEFLPSQLQHEPMVRYETLPRDPETHYFSLFLIDLDSPAPSEPLYRDFIQWVTVNISPNISHSGEVIVPYLPPCPPHNSGAHRSLCLCLSL
jgi:phosphatidylethanolamine-binding protein (PEBP) family uncharacterized protein